MLDEDDLDAAVAEGVLLSGLFAGFVIAGSPVDVWLRSPSWPPDFSVLADWFVSERLQPPVTYQIAATIGLYSAIGTIASALFYLRFRLPFALLLIAGSLVIVILATTSHFWPEAGDWVQTLILLGCGILVFATAMRFDVSDRERVSRLSDCAFWLHLLAAPLIVHSLITLVTRDLAMLSTPEALAIFAIYGVLTIVAITIDRRALLVSSLTYIGAVIAYGITRATGAAMDQPPFVVYATLAVLGAMVLIIGVGWLPLRRIFLAVLPGVLAGLLPPVPARA